MENQLDMRRFSTAYGMYRGTEAEGKLNGQINAVMQITGIPYALHLPEQGQPHHRDDPEELFFAVSILEQDVPMTFLG